jgi:hypothetical protein
MKYPRLAILLLVTACHASEGVGPNAQPQNDGDAALPPRVDGGAPTDAGHLEDADAEALSLATCDASEGVCVGLLDPTSLGGGIAPVRAVGSGKDGRHSFCYPSDPAKVTGKFLIHVVGTGADPQVDRAVLLRMCALGFVGLSPMYVNDRDGRSTCGSAPECFEGFRKEIVVGGDFVTGVSVDTANSIEGRVSTALARLAETEPAYARFGAFRDAFMARELSDVVLSGHSQGAGHALFMAREHSALRVVLLAGPSDRVASPVDAPSDWIRAFASRTKTPPSRLYGFIAAEDGVIGYDNVTKTWSDLGLPSDSCSHSSTGEGYSSACHRVIVPASGCTALDAHAMVVAETFDAACRPGALPNRNTETWKLLFGLR